jgi:hypothetical protein
MDELKEDEPFVPRALLAPPADDAPEKEAPAPAAPAEPPVFAATPEAAVAPAAATEPVAAAPPAPAAPAPRPAAPRSDRRGPRPELLEAKEPVFHEAGAYRLRMDPRDLAKLRELPGAREKTDRQLGEEFLGAQAARLVESIAGDVAADAEVRVVVDPYSRQAFLAVGRTIRGIVSF